ncbi:MAG: PIG-L family deacetylase, partial [Planctomycetaceae bacterium]|nr:PIG-L family deacetylase [Planctomycetaceae bacterium]
LARMVQQGRRVGIVDLTDGEPTPLSPGPHVRLEEARMAAEILGVQYRETLDFPNRRLFDSFEVRVALAKIFRRYRPRMVLSLFGKTPTASPDHWQAVQICDAAVFYSRLTKWDAEFDHLPPHTVDKQLWYSLGFGSLAALGSPGAFVADITDTLDLKLEAVRAYQTQFPPTKERVFQLVESQARLYGTSAGFGAGELLIPATTLGVRDVMAIVCGDD